MWSKSTFIDNKRKVQLFISFHEIWEIGERIHFWALFLYEKLKFAREEKFMRKIPLLFNDYLKNCKLCYDSEDVKSELKKRLDNIWKPITPKVFDIHDFSVV